MKRSVRRLGSILATVGVVVLACGLAARFVPLVLIGPVFLCAGVWNIRRPSVGGLAVDGVAVFLAGVFNCVAWLWVEGARGTAIGRWIFAGGVQIVWGVRRLLLYRTARFTVNDKQAIARLEAIVQELSKRSAKDDPTIAEFRTGRFGIARNRLGLYAEGAVGLLQHQVVRLEKRTDIWIEARGTNPLGRSIKVRIQMSDLELMGQMSAEHFERFEHWKLGMTRSRPIAA